MAQLIPANWKQALTDLREDIQRALERWLPKRHIKGQRSENLSARWREAMGQLQEEVSDALDRWLPKRRDTEGKDEGGWLPPSFTGAGPLIEVEETEDDVIVLAEMSGLDKDDFTVEVTADRLVLRGEKRREVEEQRAGYSYTERSFGAFARVIPLPCEVAAEKAKASYKNGLLKVTLPKTEWAKVRRVRVQVR